MTHGDDFKDALSNGYVRLDAEGQIKFLVKLANWLTLVGRETYDLEGGVADVAKLKSVNEAMHRILGQLGRLVEYDERRYPDDVFADILDEQRRILGINPSKLLEFLT